MEVENRRSEGKFCQESNRGKKPRIGNLMRWKWWNFRITQENRTAKGTERKAKRHGGGMKKLRRQ